MFKCTGICSQCGKCKHAAMMSGANDRKTKILTYPEDFTPDSQGEGNGIAFDIGTTTVVGMLWDLKEGKQIGTCARTNPQNEFGLDVISRITYCADDPQKLAVLRGKIIKCLNEIAGELCAEHNLQPADIKRIAICGNTTMSHIAAGYSPKSLAVAPFDPAYTGTLTLKGAELGINMGEPGAVTILPNIAGHVGGDITAGIAASRFLNYGDLSVFIDIGTNGEIALTDGSAAYACSTAAGPAFEGSAILHGMRAANGAIEKVIIEDGNVFFKTIGDCEPQGICGSGLIDAIAQMVKNRLINKKGRLASVSDVEKLDLDPAFKERLIEKDKERQFILVPKENGEDIVITQNDIREVQLAKGAIAAGIRLMLEETGQQVSDIRRVIVAGAFGNYIDKSSAVTIGLLPEIDQEKLFFAGNTAGAGVSMALASEAEMKLMREIPQRLTHIELAEKESFQNVYLKSMAF